MKFEPREVYELIPIGREPVFVHGCYPNEDVFSDSYVNWLESRYTEMLEALIEQDYTICRVCRIINPHHRDCPTCPDRFLIRKVIEKAVGKTWPEIQGEKE